MGIPSCGSEASYTMRCFPFARWNHSSASSLAAIAFVPNGMERVVMPAAVPASTWPRNLLLGLSIMGSFMGLKGCLVRHHRKHPCFPGYPPALDAVFNGRVSKTDEGAVYCGAEKIC